MFEVDPKKPSEEIHGTSQVEEAFKNQVPPCPNGCSNADVEQITKSTAPELRESRLLFEHWNENKQKVRIYYCKRCMSLFVIKIKLEQGQEEQRFPLAA